MTKKIKYSIIGVLSVIFITLICIFALSSCGTNNVIKLASQNATNYTMSLVYNDDTKSLYGNSDIDYINRSQDNLNEIFFHLYPNAFREDAKYKPVSSLLYTQAYINGESYGDITIKSVKVNNKEVTHSIGGQDNDILIVPLSSQLYPNSRVNIQIEYDITIPNVKHRFGYTDNAVNLGNFYPIACVYENNAFDTSPYSYNGDPFYSDISNYNVTFTCDSDFVVASSGNLKSKDTKDGKTTYNYSALAIRDFAMSLSKKFNLLETKCDGISIKYYYHSDEQPQESLETACKSVETFNDLFGKYPYSTLSVVETSFVHGGMEFPNIVFISDDLTSYEEYTNVIVHEIAHQWWYGVVGDNQNKDGYIDEGLAEYSCILFYENNPEYEITRTSIISNDLQLYLMFTEVYGDLFENFDTSMDRLLTEYTTEPEYTYMAYVKSVLMFDNLRQLIGDKDFKQGIKNFYNDNQMQFATKDTLIIAFEQASNMPLKSFFDSWIDGKIVIASN